MRFIVVILLLVTTAGFAQKKKKDKEPNPPAATQQTSPQQTTPAQQPQAQQQPAGNDTIPTASDILTEHYLRKYSVAARWNDMEVAKDALYDVIIENPGNDSLSFTLAYFYYDQGKYASSYLISNDLLARYPKEPHYLEMAASSAQQLGVNDKALGHYE